MDPNLPTRRRLLRNVGVASAALTAASVAGPVQAETLKVSKAEVKYQFTPRDADHCGECFFFIPGAGSGAPGTCKAVEGVIPQNGWCVLFAHRK